MRDFGAALRFALLPDAFRDAFGDKCGPKALEASLKRSAPSSRGGGGGPISRRKLPKRTASTRDPNQPAQAEADRILLDRRLLELYHLIEDARIEAEEKGDDQGRPWTTFVEGNSKTGGQNAAGGAEGKGTRLLCEPFLVKPDPNLYRSLYQAS